MEELIPEELADQIMRLDWRNEFREGNKVAIKEMFEAYGDQVKALNKPNVIKSVCCPKCNSEDWDGCGMTLNCNNCDHQWQQTVL